MAERFTERHAYSSEGREGRVTWSQRPGQHRVLPGCSRHTARVRAEGENGAPRHFAVCGKFRDGEPGAIWAVCLATAESQALPMAGSVCAAAGPGQQRPADAALQGLRGRVP